MSGLFGEILIGALFALICLVPARGKSLKGLAHMAYLYFTAMLMIYLGAYLVTGDMQRLGAETLGALIASGLAVYLKRVWPMGMALSVFGHGLYDYFLGHASGVMDWYPGVCAGFDLVAGLGFLFLMMRAKT